MPRKQAPRLRRPLLDINGAAEYMGFTPRQLRRWMEERVFPVPIIRFRQRVYFDPTDLDAFVNSLKREIPGRPR